MSGRVTIMLTTGESLVVFICAVAATALASFQAPINSSLGSRIGILPANFFSNVVGTAALFAAMAIANPRSVMPGFWKPLSSAPAVLWTGGLLGSLYMVTSTLVVRRLGALGWVSAAFLGQVLGGTLLDHYGLLGLERHPLGLRRLLGIVLLIAGGYFAMTDR